MGDMSDVGDRWEDRHHPNCPSVIGAGACTCTMPSDPLDLVEAVAEMRGTGQLSAAAADLIRDLESALRASRAEVERLRDVLERIAGGPVQSALCTSPTRKMEHLSTMCPHCRARAALQNEQFRGGAVAAQPGREADTEQADETVKLVIEVLDAITRDPKAQKAVEAVLPAALKATIHERLNAALAREGK